MTNTTHTLGIAASILLAAVSSASAQSMKAEIPFSFEIGKTRFQAGTYTVAVSRTFGGVPAVQFHSLETKRGAIAIAQSLNSHATPGEKAVIRFACTESRCTIAGVRTDDQDYAFPAAKPASSTRLASVLLTPNRAE